MRLFKREKSNGMRPRVNSMVNFKGSVTEAKKREIAIDYINSLSKRDLDLFIEGAQLIWQGHSILNKVKTVVEKKEEKEAKEEEAFILDENINGIDLLDIKEEDKK